MSNPTISTDRNDAFVQSITERVAHVARSLAAYVQAEPRPLGDIEAQVVRVLHDLGNALLTALLPLAAPPQPAPDLACPCGQLARYQRVRPATVSTLLGRVSVTRALYHCTSCGRNHAPLDTQLQIAAGGISAGLNEVLALLGATQDSFAQATDVLERLCLVQLCPNSARAATEDLGATLASHSEQVVVTAQQTHTPPKATCPAPPRVYVSMDGVLAHIHGAGFKELKTGCVYTTRTHLSPKRPDKIELHAERQRYLAALTDAESFGWQLWAEACGYGVSDATEVVVVGDGAHWIWNVAETHFPAATQILDWYHASEYIWNAATAIFGESDAKGTHWAKQQLDALWEGDVGKVVMRLERYSSKGEAVTAAVSYYTTHRGRMDYPTYRARGLQVGSGTIESGCKQVVSARLKLAGMIWNADGAEAVAVVRAWLKSDRWAEAMRLRPPPQRTYRRQAALPASPTPAA